MSTIKGKALLVITRLSDHGESNHFEVSAYIQSCSGGWMQWDCAQEDFQHLEYDVLPLPNAAYKLAPGHTVRVAVTFCFSHYTYDGEGDVDLDYFKQRVLRHQQPRKYYERKKA